ncbi:MAG: hypothetical protein WGN25_06155 [Candidatus Electrothrix sp. GW3-4]|uniref:hypothetical protein n=1 Tax=Candidatus Electrothrix sp. GW3-4 TaxID=3126740 RepID=UPI0030CACBB7
MSDKDKFYWCVQVVGLADGTGGAEVDVEGSAKGDGVRCWQARFVVLDHCLWPLC